MVQMFAPATGRLEQAWSLPRELEAFLGLVPLDKLAASYPAFVHLAVVRMVLRTQPSLQAVPGQGRSMPMRNAALLLVAAMIVILAAAPARAGETASDLYEV